MWGRQVSRLHSTLAQNIIQDIVFYLLPWQQGLKHAMTCSSIIRLHHLPQRTSRHASKWVVARSQGATCHLWQLSSAEAHLSFGLEHRCPCTGTMAPQLPSWLQRSQDQSLQASVEWDSHEGSSPQCRGKRVWQPWCVSHSWLIPETWEVGVSHFILLAVQLLQVHSYSAILPTC